MTNNQDNNKETADDFLKKLAKISLEEQRAARRWGIFFKVFLVIYASVGLYLFADVPTPLKEKEHAAVVLLSGEIAAGNKNNAQRINSALKLAFSTKSAKGVILQINSPGGSPVESNRIYMELLRLREKHPDKKVYVVAGDICASGGYYIAAAADEIYVDENSIVGSIGVISSGFGFVDTIKKLGVQRRVQTSGKSKNLGDPFLPPNPQGIALTQQLLDTIHDNFINAVKNGRGARLSGTDDDEVFSGAVYAGRHSIELGLADGLGSVGSVARDIIGVDEIVHYGVPESLLDSALDRFGTSVSESFFNLANDWSQNILR